MSQRRLTKGAGCVVLGGEHGSADAAGSPVALLPTELVITAERVLTDALIESSCKHTHTHTHTHTHKKMSVHVSECI